MSPLRPGLPDLLSRLSRSGTLLARGPALRAAPAVVGASPVGVVVVATAGAAARRASASALAFFATSSSTFALARSSRSRSSVSLASSSARRAARSAARSFSSASRLAASSDSRAFAIARAFIRRANSTSEIPAGRFDGSPPIGLPVGPEGTGFPALGFGTTTRLRFVSTTTFFVRPWLKLCFTLLGRDPPRPSGFLPSLSLI